MDASTNMYLARREQSSHMALVPPPPEVRQNFDHPDYAVSFRVSQIIVGVGLGFAALFIIMRVYTKQFILRNFGAEDASIILAFIFGVACIACCLVSFRYGTGRHVWDVPVEQLIPHWGQWLTAATILYCPTLMFAKLAILLTYLRISPQRNFRIAVYITMGIVLSYSMSIMLVLIFGCRPIAKAWDLTILDGKCVNKNAVYLAINLFNIATDFIILFLPAPMIKKLQMPFRQKLLIGAMFSVGSLACIVGIVRTKYQTGLLSDPDFTWAPTVPGTWLIVEICLAVCCGCLAVIRPFLRHHFPFLLGDSQRSATSERYKKATPSDYFKSSSSRKHAHPADVALDEWDKTAHGPAGASFDSTDRIAAPYPESLSYAEAGHNDEEIVRPEKAFDAKAGGAGDHMRGRDEVRIPRLSSRGKGQTKPEAGIMRTTEVDVYNVQR